MAAAVSGLVLPYPLWAEPPGLHGSATTRATAPAAPVRDVALGPGGTLRGTVYNTEGQRQSHQSVILTCGARPLARATSDDQGEFTFRGLRGGVYGLSVSGASQVYRVWTAQAAPPKAIPQVALVTGGLVQRGQRPFYELFVCDPVVLGVILAAAIAIPVAVNNSRSHRPAS